MDPPSLYRKSFTILDKSLGKYVIADSMQNLQLTGANTPAIDSTGIFYYTPSTTDLALLGFVDTKNAKTVYVKFASEAKIPKYKLERQGDFPSPDNTISVDGKQVDASFFTAGAPASTTPYVFTMTPNTTIFKLVNNKKYLAWNRTTNEFTMTSSAASAQVFEFVNGKIVLYESLHSAGKNWKEWSVNTLQLTPDLKTATVNRVYVTALDEQPSSAKYDVQSTLLCVQNMCYALNTPNDKNQLPVSKPGLLGAFNNLMVDPLTTYKPYRTLAVQYPAQVEALKSTTFTDGQLAGIIIGSLLGAALLSWLLVLLIRSNLMAKLFAGKKLPRSEMKILKDTIGG